MASAMMKPPIMRNMMGLAKPITALSKLSTPIMGWANRMIMEVTANGTVSVAHIITAKTKRANAACPELLRPSMGIKKTMRPAISAKGIPILFKFVLNSS
jgi:hypothetical protein